MKNLSNCFFAIAAAGLIALAAAQEESYVVSRDTPDWFKQSFLDFPEDVAEAADNNKRLMIYFGQDGCPYCRRLHDVNFRQSNILHLLQENFDSIAINIFGDLDAIWTDGKEYTEKSLAQTLGVQFTPTLLFLDENGDEVLRLAGYQPPVKFIAALHYVAAKKQELFADYIRRVLSKQSNDQPPLSKPPYALSAPNQKVLVFVSQRDCPACDEWREFLANSNEIWQNFALVEIDFFGAKKTIDGKTSEADWARQQNISFVPALVFLDKNGKEQFRADGYLRKFHLSSVIDYVASGAYQHEPEFQRFLQERTEKLRVNGKAVNIW